MMQIPVCYVLMSRCRASDYKEGLKYLLQKVGKLRAK